MSRFVFFALGLAVLVALQYDYWYGESGHRASKALQEKIERERRLNERLEQRNRLLGAEVMMLKEGNEVVEARARSELGMVAEGETFFLVVDEEESGP